MKKKILTICLVVWLSSLAYCQTDMMFYGIPIKGSYTLFTNQLKDKGFTFKKELKPTLKIWKGTFLNKDVDIVIVMTPTSKEVWKTSVYFKEQTNWVDLKSEFESVCSKITDKYGPVSSRYSNFNSPFEEGDGYELTAVKSDKSNFFFMWNLEAGSISVSISKSCCVQISYESKSGVELKQKEDAKIADEQL